MKDLGSNANVEELLRERAVQLANASRDERHLVPAFDVAVLATGNDRFGVPADRLREIVVAPPVTPLPDLGALLLGIAQIRGGLLSVVDVGHLFGSTDRREARYLAVVECEHGPVGLTADQLLGFRSVYTDEIADSFNASTSNGCPVQAMTKDFVSILDIEKLCGDERLVVEQN